MATDRGPLLLKIPEAAQRLGISRATLYRERDRGRIRFTPIGTGVSKRVHIDDLEAYARRQQQEAEDAYFSGEDHA